MIKQAERGMTTDQTSHITLTNLKTNKLP